MSRIGKKPIEIPEKVQVTLDGSKVKVKGPKGELSYEAPAILNIKQEDKELVVIPKDQEKETRSLWGLARTLISNMVVGVSQGFDKVLEFNGVGYKAAVSGASLHLAWDILILLIMSYQRELQLKFSKTRLLSRA